MKKVLALVLTAAMLLSCMIVGISAVREYSSETVVVSSDGYGMVDSDGGFSEYKYNAAIFSGNYTMRFVLRSNVAMYGKMQDQNGFGTGTPKISMLNGTIGFDSSTVSYTFADMTWYTIEYVVDTTAGTTTINVNGETAGVISSAMLGSYYGAMYCADVSEISFINADGSYLVHETFDGSQGLYGSGFATFGTETAEIGRYALGEKYWDWNADSAYIYIDKAGASSFSTDILFQQEDSGIIAAYFADSLIITTSTIGHGSSTVNYSFDTNVWYHVEYVAGSTNTSVYVDDTFVGTISGTSLFPNKICGQTQLVSVDNFTIDGVVEDFEDGSFNAFSNDCNGLAMAYDFGEVEEETIFDKMGESTPEGDALIIQPTWTDASENQIYYHFAVGPQGSTNTNYTIDFNLALIPNTNSSEGAYVELWTNVASRRWRVGTVNTGKTDGDAMDLTLFDWGEASPDNFHRVTYEFLDGFCTIYVDEVQVYRNLSGDVWANDGDGNEECVGSIWNGTAIIDNYKVYDSSSYELLVDGLPAHGANYKFGPKGTVGCELVAAESWCATNGHITGLTSMTTAPTCYSLGQYTTVCAVCAATTETNDIAMKAHNWAAYDFSRRTDSGLNFTYCKNSGCVEQRYTSVPTDYTGELYEYYDMQDDMCLVWEHQGWTPTTTAKDLETQEEFTTANWTVTENGELYFNDYGANYNQWDMTTYIPKNDWSAHMDITITGTHETTDTQDDPSKSDPEGYAKEIYFWYGGSNGIVVNAGYNTENNTLFLRPDQTAGAAFIAKECAFTMVEGEEYHMSVRYYYDIDENGIVSNASTSLWVDGVKMLEYATVGDAEYVLPTDKSRLEFVIFRDFAVNVLVDNMYFGSADLDLGVAYNCDLDGDCAVTAADALAMRMILVKLADETSVLNGHRVDTNGDGVVNAKDQVTIRRAMA